MKNFTTNAHSNPIPDYQPLKSLTPRCKPNRTKLEKAQRIADLTLRIANALLACG